MSDGFNPLDAALVLRDAAAACSCGAAATDDPDEPYSLAMGLLEWVVQARADMAAMRAELTLLRAPGVGAATGTSAQAKPATLRQRRKRERDRERDMSRVTGVTAGVTAGVTERDMSRRAASLSDSPSGDSELSNKRDLSEKDSENLGLIASSENARERDMSRVTERDSERDAVTGDQARKVSAHCVWHEWNRHAQHHGLAFPQSPHVEAWAAIAEACNAKPKPALALDTLCAWLWTAPDGPVAAGRVKASLAKPERFVADVNADLSRAWAWLQASQHKPAEASA